MKLIIAKSLRAKIMKSTASASKVVKTLSSGSYDKLYAAAQKATSNGSTECYYRGVTLEAVDNDNGVECVSFLVDDTYYAIASVETCPYYAKKLKVKAGAFLFSVDSNADSGYGTPYEGAKAKLVATGAVAVLLKKVDSLLQKPAAKGTESFLLEDDLKKLSAIYSKNTDADSDVALSGPDVKSLLAKLGYKAMFVYGFEDGEGLFLSKKTKSAAGDHVLVAPYPFKTSFLAVNNDMEWHKL